MLGLDDENMEPEPPPAPPGGGILGALDVIAFTYDLDLTIGGNGLANGQAVTAPPAYPKPSAPPPEKSPSYLSNQPPGPLVDNTGK